MMCPHVLAAARILGSIILRGVVRCVVLQAACVLCVFFFFGLVVLCVGACVLFCVVRVVYCVAPCAVVFRV